MTLTHSLLPLQNAKVCLIGCGGVGCEALKALVLAGIGHIEVIDLDTIELSNLNRQFLFREKHIGKSKARSAVAVMKELYIPASSNRVLIDHHGDVTSSAFGSDFMSKFDVVVGALDNIQARRHINRVCLAANVPLVESGTAGYLGQATVHLKGTSECFDCTPPSKQTVYPVCTIRSSPSKPVHCIVWAKEVFQSLFGPGGWVADETGEHADPVTKFDWTSIEEASAIPSEAKVRLQALQSQPALYVFEKLFYTDSLVLQKLGKEVEKKRIAEPLDWQMAQTMVSEPVIQGPLSTERKESIQTYATWFVDIFERLATRGILIWDKDQEDMLRFVCATANLRAHVFNIPITSEFEVKNIAGNIIPAIATTNAVVASLAVLEAMKIIWKHPMNTHRNTYIVRDPSRGRLLIPTKLAPPSTTCFVCSAATLHVQLNLEKISLQYFVEEIMQGVSGLHAPSITFGDALIYECGSDLEEEERLQWTIAGRRSLASFGLSHNAILKADDFDQKLVLDVVLYHNEEMLDMDAENLSEIYTVSRTRPCVVSEQGEDSPPTKRTRTS